MARPPIPRIAYFGNSFSNLVLPQGDRLGQSTPNGDLITSSLNTNTFGETIEFTEFEKPIAHFILAKLGAPTVRVELTPLQLKICVDEAITKLNYHAPLATKQYAVFEASAGCNLYELPRYIIDNLEYVVYRRSLLAIAQPGSIEQDFFIKYFQDNYIANDFDIGDFYILQQGLKMLRKVLGQEGSYSIIDNQYIMLHPAPQFTPDEVVLEFRAINTKTINTAYRIWIQKYAVVLAKQMLGRIRSKFNVLPSPGGGASLDGKELLLEALEEKRQLEEELVNEIEEPPTAFSLY